jgi:hypothetical protein
MDLSKLTKGDKVLAGTGIVFLISTFLAWFKVDLGIPSGLGISTDLSFSGWDVGFGWGKLPFFIVLAMLVWVGVKKFSSAKLPDELPVLYLVGGAVVAALVVLKLLFGYHGVDRAFGLYLAVLSALGVAFAGFLKFTESGGKLNEVQGQLKQMGSQATAAAKAAGESAKDSVDKSGGSDVPPPPPPPPAMPN